jgi:hypothetical protein
MGEKQIWSQEQLEGSESIAQGGDESTRGGSRRGEGEAHIRPELQPGTRSDKPGGGGEPGWVGSARARARRGGESSTSRETSAAERQEATKSQLVLVFRRGRQKENALEAWAERTED